MAKSLINRTLVLLVFLPAILAVGTLRVNCKNGCIDDEYAIGADNENEQKPFFLMKENTFDQMKHKIVIESTEKCWSNFYYKSTGSDDKIIKTKQNWPEDGNDNKNIQKVIEVNFGNKGQPSKCQEIKIDLYIQMIKCDSTEASRKMFVDYINPLKSWIEDKAENDDDETFPTFEFKTDETPTRISWDEIKSNFKDCNSKLITTEGKMTYRAKRVDKKGTKESHTTELSQFQEMFKTENYPDLTKEEKCHLWDVYIDVELVFKETEKSENKNSTTTFKRQTKKAQQSKLSLDIVKKKINASNTETHLKITDKDDKADLDCLNSEANIKKWSSDGYTNEKVLIDNKSSKMAKISLGKFLDTKCVESQIIIDILSISEPDNPTKTETTGLIDNIAFPKLERCSKISDNTIKLKVVNEQFIGCDLTYRINCTYVNSTSPNNTEVIEQQTDEFTIEDLDSKNCDAIAFIRDPDDPNPNQWFRPRKPTYCTGVSLKNENVSISAIVVSAIISGTAASGLALIFLKFMKKKRAARKIVKRISIKEVKDPHFVIKKKEILGSEVDRTDEELNTMRNDQIKETLRNLVEQQDDVVDEFNKADEYSRREIVAKETTEIAKTEINKFRNRYTDMVPYDSNILHLKVNTGNPPSTYMNASHVKFEGMKQDFVAIQAPKPPMFGSFWQSVWDQDVSVIVMITGLIEGGRTKAHQYWPDKDELIMEFGQVGLSVKYINHSYPGTYYHRKFILTNDKGKQRKIDHLQTNEWADMTAPKSTKILLDLLYKTDELMDERTGPIMVHCSAGVGRTGTYIGLYKLVSDYNDDNVEEIDFYQTLIEMRRQRMMMVQKPLQYHYMIKCLADYVARETSDYA